MECHAWFSFWSFIFSFLWYLFYNTANSFLSIHKWIIKSENVIINTQNYTVLFQYYRFNERTIPNKKSIIFSNLARFQCILLILRQHLWFKWSVLKYKNTYGKYKVQVLGFKKQYFTAITWKSQPSWNIFSLYTDY